METKKRTKTNKKTDAASAAAKELPVFSKNGETLSSVALPAELFGVSWRPDLVHQVVTAQQANARKNRAHTKDRSEVAGGGKKPWKQKGTGQARHGSIRSPLWRHGGVTFGPRNERDYHEKTNRGMRALALACVLSQKARDGEVILVEKLAFAAPSAASAKKTIAVLEKSASASMMRKHKNAALVALATYDASTVKSFRNFANLKTEEARNVNPVDLLAHKYLIIEDPATAFPALLARVKRRS